MRGEVILSIAGVSKSYGGLMAVSNLSFQVRAGAIKAVIGPNGAGKSTLFNLITGLEAQLCGGIVFNGCHMKGLKPNRRAALGLARTFQTPQIFESMSVLENVLVGRHLRGKAGLFAALLYTGRSRREDLAMRDHCYQVLEKVGLAHKAHEDAGDLACGQLKLLEMARALALDPKILLLDEFAAGLTRQETEHMMTIVRGIRDEGVTVLLVEHDMHLVMNLSDEIVVLNFGEKIGEGTPEEIQKDERVIEVYLGTEV
ncbi:MAG: ABC transporter ATP-binding protein [Rhodocyclaceae bacterium]|nr:MAG: ABC transporter ATP-binding protein [Rhodocyclaceae bacterium]